MPLSLACNSFYIVASMQTSQQLGVGIVISPYLPTRYNPLRHRIDKKPISQAIFLGIRDENAKDALAVRAAQLITSWSHIDKTVDIHAPQRTWAILLVKRHVLGAAFAAHIKHS